MVGSCGSRILFLTSKVRLHCDCVQYCHDPLLRWPFPDLKGQAPLRPAPISGEPQREEVLFLTSKVRLHCDPSVSDHIVTPGMRPFPDLKGQAPLRRVLGGRGRCGWRGFS